ncbi:MAG TPA: polysaccharide deacetylase family protein [Candidatus Saccharimonadales bacterium]|nr:polysaccharide deacetylase family protein [Candidatus Saccharimonadales bacterium]
MPATLPNHYYALPPFREYFKTGVPLLMYHKIGARPRRVRLKGLYVTPAVFARQMDELAEAGFRSAAPGETHAADRPADRVVLTFDDGFRNVFQNAMEPLARHRLRAIQFLVPHFIGQLNEWDLREGEAPEALMDAAQVREWIAAGHLIGSHSLSHSRLTRLSLRDAREEVFASKKKLEDTFGAPVEHFCYPYGDWNKAVRDLVVEADYRTACTTEFGVTQPATPPFALPRITVRHRTRTLRSLKARLLGNA